MFYYILEYNPFLFVPDFSCPKPRLFLRWCNSADSVSRPRFLTMILFSSLGSFKFRSSTDSKQWTTENLNDIPSPQFRFFSFENDDIIIFLFHSFHSFFSLFLNPTSACLAWPSWALSYIFLFFQRKRVYLVSKILSPKKKYRYACL